MSSYRQLLYHLVFRTKDSLPTIKQDNVSQLYAYITGIVKNKNSNFFPEFNGWADGYCALTCSYISMIKVIEYIINQQDHHRKKSFEEEYRSLLIESGLKIDERYFP